MQIQNTAVGHTISLSLILTLFYSHSLSLPLSPWSSLSLSSCFFHSFLFISLFLFFPLFYAYSFCFSFSKVRFPLFFNSLSFLLFFLLHSLFISFISKFNKSNHIVYSRPECYSLSFLSSFSPFFLYWPFLSLLSFFQFFLHSYPLVSISIRFSYFFLLLRTIKF